MEYKHGQNIEKRVIFNVELHCKCINSISFRGSAPWNPHQNFIFG